MLGLGGKENVPESAWTLLCVKCHQCVCMCAGSGAKLVVQVEVKVVNQVNIQ